MTQDDRKREYDRRPQTDKGRPDTDDDAPIGQYGGVGKGIGYGGGRDPKDAERPAEDLDIEEVKEDARRDS
jgi:hypothetical protein